MRATQDNVAFQSFTIVAVTQLNVPANRFNNRRRWTHQISLDEVTFEASVTHPLAFDYGACRYI